MSIKRFTPDNITKLEPMEFFVFGSNIQGEHVGGAALFAAKQFGAVEGQGFGIQGMSYAIPTCVRLWNGVQRYTKPFDNVSQIKPFVEAFISDAKRFKATFYVTKIGCGIAGFKVSEIAELFRPCIEMDNVVLPKDFVESLLYPIIINNLNKRGLIGGKDYDDDLAVKFVMDKITSRQSLDDILDEFEDLKE